MNEQGENGTKVVLVDFDESDAEEAAPINADEPQTIENIKGGRIKSGITLRPKYVTGDRYLSHFSLSQAPFGKSCVYQAAFDF